MFNPAPLAGGVVLSIEHNMNIRQSDFESRAELLLDRFSRSAFPQE
jgi:hypothetical protein